MPVPVQYISNYGFLGVAKEATFGTPLPATDYFAFESEGFETDPGVLPVPTIRGTRAENNTFYLGEIKTVGKIAMPFYPTSGMRLLAATFGSDIVQAGAAGILTPVMAAPTTSASGGVLAAATYSYRISAINANGETTAAVAQTIAALGSSSSNILTWSASAGATGYRIYGRTAGAERLIAFALPKMRDELALADKPAIPFKVPAGIKLVRVDAKSGMRAGPGDGGRTILEAFKPGTAPPDNYSVIGVADADGQRTIIPQGASPDAGNIMRPGTGGLY